MKKKYEKPSMKVYELQHRTQLLQSSADPYNGPFGYAPGIGSDENKLAYIIFLLFISNLNSI